MPVNFTAQDEQGNESTFDAQHLLSELSAAGYDAQNTSADGRSILMGEPDAKGNVVQYNVPVEDAMKSLGYYVKSALPKASEQAINPEWGALVQSLPNDDDTRRHFIESKLGKQGLPNQQVIGSGNEWHFYDPASQKWHQVTEEPKISNKTGLISAALAAPHVIGSTLGGIGGAAAGAGLGSIPMGIAGTAAGGMAGESLRQAGLSMYDPEYKSAVTENPGSSLGNVALTGGIDAAAHGVMRGAGALMPKSIAQLPGQVIGKGMANLGTLTRKAAGKIADSKLMTGFSTAFNPVLGQPAIAADVLELPAIAAKGIVAGGKALGNSTAGRRVLGPQLGDAIAEEAGEISAKRAPTGWAQKAMAGTEEGASNMTGHRMTPEATAPNVRDFLGNAVARSRAKATFDASPELGKAMSEETAAGLKTAGQYGIEGEEARAIGAGQGRDYVNNYLRQEAKKYPSNWGDTVGGVVHGVGQVGKGANAVMNQATRTGLRAVQGVGGAMEGAGVAIHGGATLGAPAASQSMLSQGLRAGENEADKRIRDYYRRTHLNP